MESRAVRVSDNVIGYPYISTPLPPQQPDQGFVVKLRQGSGKDGQGLVNKRPLMAPNGLKGLSTLA